MNPKEYSKHVTEQMKKMRFEEKMTLEAIAQKFGVSRERVRQRIGNTGKGIWMENTVEKYKQLASFVDKTNDEIRQMFHIKVLGARFYKERVKLRHAVNGFLGVGTKVEIMVSQELDNLGIDNTLMPHHHPFDILLGNGKRVDVKSRTHRTLPPSQAQKLKNGGQWRFVIDVSRRGQYADFFVLYIWETKDFFVIPASEAKNDQIVFSWPPAFRPSKWHKYHNRFDLLK